MNNDLISREALKKAFKIEELYWGKRILDEIDNALTVEVPNYAMGYQDGVRKVLKEVAEGKHRPQGEWIKQYNKSYELITDEGTLIGEFTKCPKCLYDKARGSNFCPNCGADMRGEKK